MGKQFFCLSIMKTKLKNAWFFSTCDWPSNAIRVRQECGSTFSYFSTTEIPSLSQLESETAKTETDFALTEGEEQETRQAENYAFSKEVRTDNAKEESMSSSLAPSTPASFSEPDLTVAGSPIIFAKNEPQLLPNAKSPRGLLTG